MSAHFRRTLALVALLGMPSGCSNEPPPAPSNVNPFAAPQGGSANSIPIAPSLHHTKTPEVAQAPVAKPPAKPTKPPLRKEGPRAMLPPGTDDVSRTDKPDRTGGKDRKPPVDKPAPEPEEAVAEIQRLGGKLKFDEKSPDRHVVSIDFSGTKLDNAGLRNVAKMSTLKSLNLRQTNITGPGLDNLKDLTNLKTLNLDGTRITNADLRYLQNLTSLEELYLYATRVNGLGVNALKKALPKLKINH